MNSRRSSLGAQMLAGCVAHIEKPTHLRSLVYRRTCEGEHELVAILLGQTEIGDLCNTFTEPASIPPGGVY